MASPHGRLKSPLQQYNRFSVYNEKIIIASKDCNTLTSISTAKVGYNKYQNGNYGNSNVLTPIYLRKSQAELALEKVAK